MTEAFAVKKGDRVRVVYEGVVDWAGNHGTFVLEGSEGGHYDPDPTRVSIEVQTDPEPTWVNGDVVRVDGWRLGYYFNGAWYSADRSKHIFSGAGGSAVTLSDYWKRGEVEILVRDDKLVADAS